MTLRSYNFSAGPAAIPTEVLEKAAEGLLQFTKGVGIQEISHRSPEFIEIRDGLIEGFKKALNIPNNYKIFLCQGGATMQFSLLPMNLLLENRKSDYLNTGIWANKAFKAASFLGDAKEVASSESDGFTYIPKEYHVRDDTSYLHITSNNTVYGTQIHNYPKNLKVPLIADMSSDILSRKINVEDFGLIYAGAQKNLGPSGVVLVIIREDLLDRVPSDIPDIFSYDTYVKHNSMFNTPPTFGFYVLYLMLKWVDENGGVEAFEKLNAQKAKLIYDTIDESDFYSSRVKREDRSLMNIIYSLPSEELTDKFIKAAEKEALVNLKGYRLTGGIRASIYNSVSLEACQILSSFMKNFAEKNA